VCHVINVTDQLGRVFLTMIIFPASTMKNVSEPSRTTCMLISGQKRVCKLAGIIFVRELAVYIAVIKFSTSTSVLSIWVLIASRALDYCFSQEAYG